jgi:CTP synthase
MVKYIFVTGGVLSGVGKGITAASVARLLKSCGYKVNIQKCDPYLNVDAGTLNPREHGECFVTDDGAETDLDLGHYERFLNQNLNQKSSTMSGRLLRDLIEDERAGKFKGETVQVIPHLTQVIARDIKEAAKGYDIHVVELGGTVGDYESLAFVEAFRRVIDDNTGSAINLHVVYVPYLGASREFKTKPAQNALRDLRAFGIAPDVLAVRSEEPLSEHSLGKFYFVTGLERDSIVSLPNANDIYEVPLSLEEQGIAEVIQKKLNLKVRKPDLKTWEEALLSSQKAKAAQEVKVGIVAKYLDNEDTYFSVIEALRHAAAKLNLNLSYGWVDAEKITKDNVATELKSYDAVLVPGGFGNRGVEGKIIAADHCLNPKNRKPYLGLCLGMQVAAIAAARKILGDHSVTSQELDNQAKHQIIHIIEDKKHVENIGGTLRLGSYTAKLQPGSRANKLYGKDEIDERHRHRFEFNNDYEAEIEKGGLIVSGRSPDGKLVEILESPDHRFFVGVQYHPEFKSRPEDPHPLFVEFLSAASTPN